MMSIYLERIEQVRAKLDEWQADGLLVMSPHNRRWLTGFTGSAGDVMITRDGAFLGTDGRYWSQAAQQAPDYTIFEKPRAADAREQFVRSTAVTRIAIEGKHVSLADFQALRRFDGIEWVPLQHGVEPWRSVKSGDEVEAIRAAAAITDHVMNQVPALVQVGMSERALAWELEKALRDNGADGMAFDILVASGANAAKPHHHPGGRTLQVGDTLIVDMGAKLNGYHSDLTRSFHIGSDPDARFWQVYNTVLAAQEQCLNHMKAGMTGAEIDSLARTVIADAGYAAAFKHSTGHSLGLEIHENPGLRETAVQTIIPDGAVITVEPGIYLDAWGGIRIEDLVVVTNTGVEFLSHCPKTPIIQVTSNE